MKAIEELSPQIGTSAACQSLGVPRATLYRHRQSKPPKPTTAPRPKPPRALDEQERRKRPAEHVGGKRQTEEAKERGETVRRDASGGGAGREGLRRSRRGASPVGE